MKEEVAVWEKNGIFFMGERDFSRLPMIFGKEERSQRMKRGGCTAARGLMDRKWLKAFTNVPCR